jgi:cell shape-determining protein MreC
MTPRSSHSPPGARRLLLMVVGLLLLLAVLPSRWTRWTSSLGAAAEFLISPIQAPLTELVRALRPASSPLGDRPERVAALEEAFEELRTAYRRVEEENLRLRRLAADLQRGVQLAPEVAVRQLPAPVIGLSMHLGRPLLKVRGGSSSGVDVRGVAVHDGVFLVGPVISVEPRIAWVKPSTTLDPDAPDEDSIQGIIFTNERLISRDDDGDGQARPDVAVRELSGPIAIVGLRPTGRGTLEGPVGAAAGQALPAIEPGMVVRLRDPRERVWPRHAQMLIVGVVEGVQHQPVGRPRVTVRPLYDPRRLSDVVLRLGPEDAP